MSTLLMLEVMDDAPDWLTWRERYVLMALADNFNDATRLGWPAYDGDGERSEKFRRRARCTRRQFYETLGELIDKGVLVVEVSGHNGRQAVYRMPPLASAKPLPPGGRRVRKTRTQQGVAEGVADTLPEGFQEPSANTHGTLTEPSLGAETPHTTDDVVCGNDGSRVRRNRTPIPQVSSTLKELNTSSSAVADRAAVPLGDSASAGAPAGDGLRPRGCAAPEAKTNRRDDDLDCLPPAVAADLERAREQILTMSGEAITRELRTLAERFPEIYQNSLSHTSSLGIAYDRDAFSREALRYGMQLYLIEKHDASTAA